MTEQRVEPFVVHSDQPSTCIVGAGQAGSELAFSLRQRGCEMPIVLIGAEPHLPYQRPPLSKTFLKGECGTEALYLKQRAAYERANIELLLNTRVEHIDTRSRTLTLSDERRLRYTKLALAIGGRARKLTLAGAERAVNCHYLRTIDDVGRIRDRFRRGEKLVIVGGGYVGLEVAAVAIAHGLQVTLLEAMPSLLTRVTAPQMSSFYERVHREAGVDVRTDAQVVGFTFNELGDTVTHVHCADGSTLAAGLVVVGIGLVPNTELAQLAGLAVDDGILVDEYARTSDPDIVALGDCANHPSVWNSGRLRLESVPNAIEQARTAASTLTGTLRAYDAVPWFWSEQYDLKLQMAGLLRGHDSVVLRGSMSTRSFSLFYLSQGRLLASSSVNRPQEFLIAKQVIGRRGHVNPELLADESVPLKAALL